ncbi:MAG: glycogen debranching protein GlgX [Hyphomicrobiaceae bacterium]
MGDGTALDLGARVQPNGVNFAVVARHADAVDVCVFDADDREQARFRLPTRQGDVHCGFLAGATAGLRYGLIASGPWAPERGHRYDAAKLLVDPYATRLDRPYAWNSRLAVRGEVSWDLVPKAIVEAPFAEIAPLAPRPLGFVYEVSVKALTQLHPGVREGLRGTVAALAEPCVVDHLRGLGVETVELMPLTAWIDERHLPPLGLANAWGYNPVGFFAPDPRLAPGGMEEIRRTIGKLHAAGLRVILDVVLNHTGESDANGATLSLRGLDNALYYRHGPDGSLVNDTGCGNTLALDRAPVVRLAMDSLRHWALAGFDGFRFDLAPVLGRTERGFTAEAPLLAAIAQDPLLARLVRVAEPWDVGPYGYRLGGFGAPWHEWNDRYRDRVRRFWRGDVRAAGDFATAISGSSDVFDRRTRQPSASINFVAAHDGFTLHDAVSYSDKRNAANGENNRDGHAHEVSWTSVTPQADLRAMLATLFLSLGTPMLSAGDEFGRTQSGNNNAYAQDNAVTWLDWGAADLGLAAFAARLAQLRRRLSAFGVDAFLEGRDVDGSGDRDAVWLGCDGRELTAATWSDDHLDTLGLVLTRGERIAIWFNRSSQDTTCRLAPPRAGCTWRIALDTADDGRCADRAPDAEAVVAAARSVLVLEEVASANPRCARGASDDELAGLSTAAGILAEWYEVSGAHHRVSPETQRALLAAMGLACATRDDIQASTALLREETTLRPLPAIATTLENGHGSLDILLPVHRGRRPLRLDLVCDDGRRLHVDAPAGALVAVGEATSRGLRMQRYAVPLPPLPAGRYTVTCEAAGETAGHLIVHPPGCHLPPGMAGGRRSFGIAAHLYALRDERDWGIGDFQTLGRFVAATERAGGVMAGINPLHHLFPTDRARVSPYQPSDRHFIDPIYIDLDDLVAEFGGAATRRALREHGDVAQLRARSHIDYARVWTAKRAVLQACLEDCSGRGLPEFAGFVCAGGDKLRNHALFETLAEEAGTVDRSRWPEAWRAPSLEERARLAERFAEGVRLRCFLQWCAERQLARAGARSSRVGLYRDLALGVARDSGEVWSAPDVFAKGVSIGAPPDPFAADGQNWNLPPFIPQELLRTGLAPMAEIIAANMRSAGALRIDHVLGFARQFWIPDGASGAQGAYVGFPIDALIALTSQLSAAAGCCIIGEDLGTVPPGLREKLAAASILSYRVLWLEREGDGAFRRTSAYPPLSAACLSSHDLQPFLGWTASADAAERGMLERAIGEAGLATGETGEDLMVAAHAMVAQAPSTLMLVQADDLAGECEPLNVPGTDRERPNWRRRLGATIADWAESPLAKATISAVARQRQADA